MVLLTVTPIAVHVIVAPDVHVGEDEWRRPPVRRTSS
jgi:hypothetical protein